MEKNSSCDYFHGLMEPKLSRIIFMTFSVFLNLACIALSYSVIWYERFGVNIKRTIMNQLFSQQCWTGIEFILMVTVPEWFRFLLGPLPELPCWLHLVIKNGIFAKLMLLQTGLIVTRHALIFWIKNPFAFKDDFWFCFINIWSNIFSFWPHFIFAFLPGQQPVGYYICTGQDPAEDKEMPPKFNYIHFIVGYSGLVLHILISIRIYFYKNKVKPIGVPKAPSSFMAPAYEKNSLSGFITITGSSALLMAVGFLFITYSSIEPKHYNQLPDYLFIYWTKLVNAPLTFVLILLFYFAKNGLMRTVMVREAKEFIRSFKGT